MIWLRISNKQVAMFEILVLVKTERSLIKVKTVKLPKPLKLGGDQGSCP